MKRVDFSGLVAREPWHPALLPARRAYRPEGRAYAPEGIEEKPILFKET
jgi:hypothetical protein